MEIVVARGPLARLRGLIARPSWPPGVALEIPRCRSVHTFGMGYALDLVWLDGARRVVRVDLRVPPWRVRGCRAARSVLEVRSPGVPEVRTPGIEGGGIEAPEVRTPGIEGGGIEAPEARTPGIEGGGIEAPAGSSVAFVPPAGTKATIGPSVAFPTPTVENPTLDRRLSP